MQRSQHSAGMPVKAILCAIIPDFTNRLAYDIIHTMICRRRHLTHNHDDAGRRAGFAGNTGIRIPCSRIASNTASLIWSQILSGCPSVTDSDVNNLFISFSPLCVESRLFIGIKKAARLRKSGGTKNHTSSADISAVGFSTEFNRLTGLHRAYSLRRSQ